MEPTFVILKGLDLVNFGWLEVVQDLQTAEELSACEFAPAVSLRRSEGNSSGPYCT